MGGIDDPVSAGLDEEARRGLRGTRGEGLFDEHEAICAGQRARPSTSCSKDPT